MKYNLQQDAGYIDDLAAYLNKKTGTTEAERQEWREAVGRLMDEARAESDSVKRDELRNEAMRVFGSFEYWREKYKGVAL